MSISQAERDVLAERRRQIVAERWTLEHDDKHIDGSIAMAAACYSLPPPRVEMEYYLHDRARPMVPKLWPVSWNPFWWKPRDRRANLVRAGALIIAEIERLDRRSIQKVTP